MSRFPSARQQANEPYKQRPGLLQRLGNVVAYIFGASDSLAAKEAHEIAETPNYYPPTLGQNPPAFDLNAPPPTLPPAIPPVSSLYRPATPVDAGMPKPTAMLAQSPRRTPYQVVNMTMNKKSPHRQQANSSARSVAPTFADTFKQNAGFAIPRYTKPAGYPSQQTSEEHSQEDEDYQPVSSESRKRHARHSPERDSSLSRSNGAGSKRIALGTGARPTEAATPLRNTYATPAYLPFSTGGTPRPAEMNATARKIFRTLSKVSTPLADAPEVAEHPRREEIELPPSASLISAESTKKRKLHQLTKSEESDEDAHRGSHKKQPTRFGYGDYKSSPSKRTKLDKPSKTKAYLDDEDKPHSFVAEKPRSPNRKSTFSMNGFADKTKVAKQPPKPISLHSEDDEEGGEDEDFAPVEGGEDEWDDEENGEFDEEEGEGDENGDQEPYPIGDEEDEVPTKQSKSGKSKAATKAAAADLGFDDSNFKFTKPTEPSKTFEGKKEEPPKTSLTFGFTALDDKDKRKDEPGFGFTTAFTSSANDLFIKKDAPVPSANDLFIKKDAPDAEPKDTEKKDAGAKAPPVFSIGDFGKAAAPKDAEKKEAPPTFGFDSTTFVAKAPDFQVGDAGDKFASLSSFAKIDAKLSTEAFASTGAITFGSSATAAPEKPKEKEPVKESPKKPDLNFGGNFTMPVFDTKPKSPEKKPDEPVTIAEAPKFPAIDMGGFKVPSFAVTADKPKETAAVAPPAAAPTTAAPAFDFASLLKAPLPAAAPAADKPKEPSPAKSAAPAFSFSNLGELSKIATAPAAETKPAEAPSFGSFAGFPAPAAAEAEKKAAAPAPGLFGFPAPTTPTVTAAPVMPSFGAAPAGGDADGMMDETPSVPTLTPFGQPAAAVMPAAPGGVFFFGGSTASAVAAPVVAAPTSVGSTPAFNPSTFNPASLFGSVTAPAVAAPVAPAFGSGNEGMMSDDTPAPAPAFGSAFGAAPTPNFGQSNVFNSTAVPTPNFGAAPTPNFGGAPTPNFGAAPTPNFGGTPSFGAAPTPNFGGAPSFGGAPAPNFGAAAPAPSFGAAGAPNFGTPAPNFGAAPTPSFGGAGVPNFGPTPTAAPNMFGGGVHTPSFGGAPPTMPTFGGAAPSPFGPGGGAPMPSFGGGGGAPAADFGLQQAGGDRKFLKAKRRVK